MLHSDVTVSNSRTENTIAYPNTSRNVAVSSGNQTGGVNQDLTFGVDVDDVYYEIYTPLSPLNACGAFGFVSPLLLTFGLLALRRRGHGV